MAEVPPVFSHDVKIEQTAKGVRVTVHVHTNDGPEAMFQAVALYRQTIEELGKNNLPVAPIEIGRAKE